MNFKQALTREELEALLKPHLRLFLSVDVVDSTALKHVSREENPAKSWLPFILGFYTGFPGMFSEHFGKVLARNGGETKLREPYLWKASGDELIFSVPLEHPAHLRFYLKAFRFALIHAIENWAKGSAPPLPINFKGTAWLAGFPVFNTAVPIEAPAPMTEDSEHFDFVGPLIDIGFRLAKFATPRKFVVSADIAWLVTRFGDTSGLNFFYDGREKLKGVLNGISYPVFWVDCEEGLSDAHSLEGIEDRLLGRDACKPAVIAELAKAFLDSVQDFIPKPFFHGLKDIDPEFKAPVGFDAMLKAAQAQLERIYMPDFSAKIDIPTNPKQSNTQAIKDLLAELEKPLSPIRKPPPRKHL